MRIRTSVMAVSMMALGLAAAKGAGKAAESKLMVCLDPDGKAATIDGGLVAAAQVFRTAGIRVEWQNTERPCLEHGGIVVTLAPPTPTGQHPGALAYALPYERTHIVLLLDRVLNSVPRPMAPRLIGYVLAHEIGHMLEGVNRHSDFGVMKPHWDNRDYADMQLGRLRFAPLDVELMQEGLLKRTGRSMIVETGEAKR
jgi:hypothetical protein